MRKLILAATVACTLPVSALAAPYYVLDLGAASRSTESNLTGHPHVDAVVRVNLSNVLGYRLSVQGRGYSPYGTVRVMVQVSLDNGDTWSCLGAACTYVELPETGPATPLGQTLLTSVPTDQRKASALLRLAFEDLGETSLLTYRSTVQFYR